MYLVVGEPVSNDPGTLMDPQCQDIFHIGTCLMLNMQQPLPDPREIPQVENVVEFSRCGKHFNLREGEGERKVVKWRERHREKRRERNEGEEEGGGRGGGRTKGH